MVVGLARQGVACGCLRCVRCERRCVRDAAGPERASGGGSQRRPQGQGQAQVVGPVASCCAAFACSSGRAACAQLLTFVLSLPGATDGTSKMRRAQLLTQLAQQAARQHQCVLEAAASSAQQCTLSCSGATSSSAAVESSSAAPSTSYSSHREQRERHHRAARPTSPPEGAARASRSLHGVAERQQSSTTLCWPRTAHACNGVGHGATRRASRAAVAGVMAASALLVLLSPSRMALAAAPAPAPPAAPPPVAGDAHQRR